MNYWHLDLSGCLWFANMESYWFFSSPPAAAGFALSDQGEKWGAF